MPVIENITRWRENMNFMFEWQEQYLSSEPSERNRYCSCHENIKSIYHMTRTPRAQFPWKTIREKVPYEGRTRRSDRAGKTRTALLETATAKSMQVNFVPAKVCSLQNKS